MQPLETFEESWRWEDIEGFPGLPVLPLSGAAAQLLWDFSLKLTLDKGSDYRPRSDLVEVVDQFSTEAASGVVSRWLEGRLPPCEHPLLVSWQPASAVQTTRDFFCCQWRAFCLPGRDDTLVVPLLGDWLIHYWHEEVLYFGVPKKVKS